MTDEDPTEATYFAIAQQALADALAERNYTVENVTAHFKRRCAKHDVPRDGLIMQRAIAAALASRDRAYDTFLDTYRSVRGGRVRRE
jgi:hypothetical protein